RSTNATTMTAPSRKTGSVRSRSQALFQRLTPSSSESVPASARASMRAFLRSPGLVMEVIAGSSPSPDARVDDRVGDVDQQVDDDVDECGHHDQHLQHGVVAPLEADGQRLSDALEGEDLLGQDGTRQEGADLEPDDGDDRDEG